MCLNRPVFRGLGVKIMPKISVIMPIYQTRPDYLRQAVRSILAQTFKDFEFLILNDSPDNTTLDKIIAEFSDSRIKFMRSHRNMGVAGAHNFLLKHAQGDYIAVMDHDDISLPQRLEKQFAFLESHTDVGICGTAYWRFGKWTKMRSIYPPEHHDDICALLLFKCPLHHPSAMIRRSVLVQHQIAYDEHFISLNDRKLYMEIARYTRLANLNQVLYNYRLHKQMTSRIMHDEINREQLAYRDEVLKDYGIIFDENDKYILNHYIFTGRTKINNIEILPHIDRILTRLVQENQDKHFCDEAALAGVCGRYLVKRCKNAACWGGISSSRVLAQTTLPVVSVPWWLNILNRIGKVA